MTNSTGQESGSKGGGPDTQGAGKTVGQQGSPHGGQEGKQGSSNASNDNRGNSRDANAPDNKTARKNENAGE